MIFLITGDIHAHIDTRFNELNDHYDPSQTAIIVLGDLGANYYLNKKDKKFKEQLNNLGYTFYCVHGNHEERPEKIKGMKLVYDKNVKGMVYFEEEYPNIKYFKIWGQYMIGYWKTAIIGGAYSVDKQYRIMNKWQWFPSEQLNQTERKECFDKLVRSEYDLVLSHTCPLSWQPTDLFLSCIDQSKVDNSMECFLENLKENMMWDIWLFGHYHDDRVVRPRVQMLFDKVYHLDTLMFNWFNPK